MRRPLEIALADFLSSEVDTQDFDHDSLATIAQHFRATVLERRLPRLVLLHYADMVADPHAAVRRLAEGARISADVKLVNEVVNATAFDAMRAQADRFAPQGGKGFWEDDAAFFDSGGTGKWHGQLDGSDLERYGGRMAELVPNEHARQWLEVGGKDLPGVSDCRRSRQIE